MHWNLGTWPGVARVPPRVQIILWRSWRGLRWHRWTGGIGLILRGSLILGCVELRFWRRPTLHTTVTYPEAKR